MKLALDTSHIYKAKDIQQLLDYATETKISVLDTAASYGESEATLGQYNLENFDVITKTIKYDYTLSRSDNFENIKDAFYLSQRKLGYIELYGLMFHSAGEVLHYPELWDLVSDFKDKEYVYKLGVSVSNPEELIEVIDTYDVDIVQLPLNIFDQRFVGILPELRQKGIEVHTRNTFNDGILLKNEWQLSEKYRSFKPMFQRVPEPKAAYALAFPKLLREVDKIIVPALSVNDLEYFINMYNFETEDIDFAEFRIN